MWPETVQHQYTYYSMAITLSTLLWLPRSQVAYQLPRSQVDASYHLGNCWFYPKPGCWKLSTEGLVSQTETFAIANVPWFLETIHIMLFDLQNHPLIEARITLFYKWQKSPCSHSYEAPKLDLGPAFFNSKTHSLPAFPDKSHSLLVSTLKSYLVSLSHTETISLSALPPHFCWKRLPYPSVSKLSWHQHGFSSCETGTYDFPHHPVCCDGCTLWANHTKLLLLPKNNASPSVI